MIRSLYLKFISVCYFIGGILHALDILDLRLNFTKMNSVWKSWILFLLVFDFIASIGLWKEKKWGLAAFILVAMSQLIAYTFFKDIFGDQSFLINFHLITILILIILTLPILKRSKTQRA